MHACMSLRRIHALGFYWLVLETGIDNFCFQAKPCRNLWVGGISPAVSREQLEEEFSKFGKIDEFKFLRDRNTAFIEYVRLEDASQALRIMNGKRIGGDQIRVDFLRSQPMRRVSMFRISMNINVLY